jgi:hypothetical protein
MCAENSTSESHASGDTSAMPIVASPSANAPACQREMPAPV